MSDLNAFIGSLASDPIANRHGDIGRLLVSSQDRHFQTLNGLMMHLLPRVEHCFPDLTSRRAFASYIVDSFWESGRVANLDTTTRQIKEFARSVPVLKSYDAPLNPDFSSLADCIYTSADLLQFMWGKYSGHLSQNFSDAFIVGSLNYGRFYSIRGKEHVNKSDIDLVLVPINPQVGLGAFGVNLAPINMLDVDARDRLVEYQATPENERADMLNYKIFCVEQQVEVSINIGSPAGIGNILKFRNAANETCSVNRTISMGGRNNVLSDLTGKPFNEEYTEKQVSNGYVLELRHYSDRYGGLTAMFTPRVGRLFSSKRTDGLFAGFERDLSNQMAEMRRMGKVVSLCNAHPRRSRFSPLFKEMCDAAL